MNDVPASGNKGKDRQVCGPLLATSDSTDNFGSWIDRELSHALRNANHKGCHFKFQNQSRAAN